MYTTSTISQAHIRTHVVFHSADVDGLSEAGVPRIAPSSENKRALCLGPKDSLTSSLPSLQYLRASANAKSRIFVDSVSQPDIKSCNAALPLPEFWCKTDCVQEERDVSREVDGITTCYFQLSAGDRFHFLPNQLNAAIIQDLDDTLPLEVAFLAFTDVKCINLLTERAMDPPPRGREDIPYVAVQKEDILSICSVPSSLPTLLSIRARRIPECPVVHVEHVPWSYLDLVDLGKPALEGVSHPPLKLSRTIQVIQGISELCGKLGSEGLLGHCKTPLTAVLCDAFGGNANVSFLLHLDPKNSIPDVFNALSFGLRLRKINNRVRLNPVDPMIFDLRKQITRLNQRVQTLTHEHAQKIEALSDQHLQKLEQMKMVQEQLSSAWEREREAFLLDKRAARVDAEKQMGLLKLDALRWKSEYATLAEANRIQEVSLNLARQEAGDASTEQHSLAVRCQALETGLKQTQLLLNNSRKERIDLDSLLEKESTETRELSQRLSALEQTLVITQQNLESQTSKNEKMKSEYSEQIHVLKTDLASSKQKQTLLITQLEQMKASASKDSVMSSLESKIATLSKQFEESSRKERENFEKLEREKLQSVQEERELFLARIQTSVAEKIQASTAEFAAVAAASVAASRKDQDPRPKSINESTEISKSKVVKSSKPKPAPVTKPIISSPEDSSASSSASDADQEYSPSKPAVIVAPKKSKPRTAGINESKPSRKRKTKKSQVDPPLLAANVSEFESLKKPELSANVPNSPVADRSISPSTTAKKRKRFSILPEVTKEAEASDSGKKYVANSPKVRSAPKDASTSENADEDKKKKRRLPKMKNSIDPAKAVEEREEELMAQSQEPIRINPVKSIFSRGALFAGPSLSSIPHSSSSTIRSGGSMGSLFSGFGVPNIGPKPAKYVDPRRMRAIMKGFGEAEAAFNPPVDTNANAAA